MKSKTKIILLVLSIALLGGIVLLTMLSNTKPNAGRELVVVSYGGSFQEAQRKAFFEPFQTETGIRIREVQWSGEFAKLKAMVQSGEVTWDLVTAAESSIIERGIKEGLLEKIDYSQIDRNRFFPKALTDYSFGFDYFSTVLAFNETSFPPEKPQPQNWKDFWDTEKFPGARSLRKDPRTTLEFALLADGVLMEKLYPLDVDRAFRSLDRISKDNKVWWTSGHQPAQLLADKEVVMVSAFNGRIWAAANKDKVPLSVVWNGGALDVDAWIIPKGTKKYKEAMALVQYTARPDVQLRLTKYISYSPTMPEAFDQVPSPARRDLPTAPENYRHQFVFDGKWWAENEEKVLERWNQWLLKQ